jgi:hypothetical protein
LGLRQQAERRVVEGQFPIRVRGKAGHFHEIAGPDARPAAGAHTDRSGVISHRAKIVAQPGLNAGKNLHTPRAVRSGDVADGRGRPVKRPARRRTEQGDLIRFRHQKVRLEIPAAGKHRPTARTAHTHARADQTRQRGVCRRQVSRNDVQVVGFRVQVQQRVTLHNLCRADHSRHFHLHPIIQPLEKLRNGHRPGFGQRGLLDQPDH